jgi:hypothetical protein
VSAVVKFNKPLSVKEERFVEFVAIHGLSYAAAARQADMGETGSVIAARPHVAAAIAEQRANNAQKMELTRDKILQGIMDAIKRAEIIGEPMTEIAGWREAAKISGFYEAPKDKRELTDKQQRFLQMIQELPEEQLLAMLAKDVNIIDGDPVKKADSD